MTDRIDTICVQGGYRPGNGEPRQIPIVQSTTFKYDTSEDMGSSLTWRPRATSTPACKTHLRRRGGQDRRPGGRDHGDASSSGQAANFYAVFNIASCGDHVVASNSIYGGTYNLFPVP